MQLTLITDPEALLPRVRARLLAAYGPQRDPWRLDPVSQLVLAIISSRTRDEVSLEAFRVLRQSYQAWEALSRGAPREIEAIIRPVNHADRKAEQLPRALRMITARCGRLDLDFLQDWPEETALVWLQDLPGVGMRNAATVLNFSKLRKRVLSVGTHLLRVGGRLGLTSPRADYTHGYRAYMRLVPDEWDADDLYELHWLIKYIGQRMCTYSRPDCRRCLLRDLCPVGASCVQVESLASEPSPLVPAPEREPGGRLSLVWIPAWRGNGRSTG